MKKILFIAAALSGLLLTGCKEDPEPLHYEGFSIETTNDVIQADRGETLVLEGNVICQNGVKHIEAVVGAWDGAGTATKETIEVTGSPKTYKLSYIVEVPIDAEVETCDVKFTIHDYAGSSIDHTFRIALKEDTEAPTLNILSPTENQAVSPHDPLSLELVARDNLALQELVIRCDELELDRRYEPSSDLSVISVRDNVDISEANGEYTILFTATDLSGNTTEESRTIRILVASKPEIRRQETGSGYASPGGKIRFALQLSTNIEHTLTQTAITSSALGINETLSPGSNTYLLEREYTIPTDFGVQECPITVSVRNDLDEESNLTLYYNTLDQLYVIGTATMAKQKESQALLMTRQTDDPNVYTLTTWIDAAGDWFKILSERSWNGVLNLGLDESGEKLANSDRTVPINATGYHTITFDLSTWEYTVEEYDAPQSGTYPEMYVSGQDFSYLKNGVWTAVSSWDEMIPLTPYPGNPHRFYIDIICRKCVFGLSAQPNKEDGGTFFGIPGDPGWKWVWWEFVEPLVSKTSDAEIAKPKEDGRENNVMRITVDTHLNLMSWLESQEYTYPAPATQQ